MAVDSSAVEDEADGGAGALLTAETRAKMTKSR